MPEIQAIELEALGEGSPDDKQPGEVARRHRVHKQSFTSAEDTSADQVLWPIDVQHRYRRSGPTILRWERSGRIPARDVVIGGERVAWRLSTLQAAERGATATA